MSDDELTTFAETHAEALTLMADIVQLLAQNAPSVLLHAEPVLRIHSRVGSRLLTSIEEGVASLAEFDHFLAQHPELT